MATLQKIVPNLWFNGNAEKAVNFYISVFKNSSTGDKTYYGKAGYEFHKMAEGTLLTWEFTVEGQEFTALNAGPEFKFNEAISFIINCDSEEELDYYWERLSEGSDPASHVCGWLRDKFGVSWQIVPREFLGMVKDKDAVKVERVMNAMFHMKKLDLHKLRQAFHGQG